MKMFPLSPWPPSKTLTHCQLPEKYLCNSVLYNIAFVCTKHHRIASHRKSHFFEILPFKRDPKIKSNKNDFFYLISHFSHRFDDLLRRSNTTIFKRSYCCCCCCWEAEIQCIYNNKYRLCILNELNADGWV